MFYLSFSCIYYITICAKRQYITLQKIRGNKEFTFIPGLKSGVFPFMFDNKNYYISREKSSLSSEESTGAAGTAF